MGDPGDPTATPVTPQPQFHPPPCQPRGCVDPPMVWGQSPSQRVSQTSEEAPSNDPGLWVLLPKARLPPSETPAQATLARSCSRAGGPGTEGAFPLPKHHFPPGTEAVLVVAHLHPLHLGVDGVHRAVLGERRRLLLPAGCGGTKRFTESQNHGIIQAGKDLQDHQAQLSTLNQAYKTTSPSATSTCFLIPSRDGDSPTALGSLVQGLTTLSGKNFFPISNLNLP